MEQHSIIILVCVLTVAYYYHYYGTQEKRRIAKLPVAGRRSRFEPDWLLRLRFLRGSRGILQHGYDKYRDLFVVKRAGADVIVIATQELLEQVRSQTRDIAQSTPVFLKDFHSDYTHGNVIGESNLQNRVVQEKLTPALGTLIPIMKDEMDIALGRELAACGYDEWTEIDSTPIFARVAASVISRLWLGSAGRDNREWVKITDDYTTNVFITGFILRFVPSILRPVIAPLLPSYRALVKRVYDAREYIGGLAKERTPGDTTASDVLQWTMNLADPNAGELDMGNLAQRILVLSLAGIHTTALTMAQAFFDLAAHPTAHIPIIRQEIIEVMRSRAAWDRDGLAKLHKLDSLIKESQRHSPVFLLTYNRFLPRDVELSNGVHLRAGTRIGVPQHAIGMDSANIPGDPQVYDPWRYSRLREAPENQRKYTFAQTDTSHMAFGFGRYACFGRFLASDEIKLVLATMVLTHDFKLPEGHSRPRNFTVDGDMYPDRKARVMMRKRRVEQEVEHLVPQYPVD